MVITGSTLFAFVDLKDPFMPGEVAGEERPGPILSLAGGRHFDFLYLFHTPHTRENAAATEAEVKRRYPHCRVALRELPVSDPKDYASLLGRLAQEVREILGYARDTENYASVSSGTVEMRGAWFLLAAAGVLEAKLLQVGAPTEPLFGETNIKEVRLDSGDWMGLRGQVMPAQYLAKLEPEEERRGALPAMATRLFRRRLEAAPAPAPEAPPPLPGLEEALQELGIFIGSATLRAAAERAAIAAQCDAPVLLQGETGTGKELFAKLIHRLSERHGGLLVAINCAAIPRELVESYLFGHVKGAFTGASRDQKGKFEHADGGTLFLDEIGELTAEAQAKLLRVLQDGVVEPLGSSRTRKVDVRIVAATNRNLRAETASGRFREDLYYRLEVVHIELPPLRERRTEIPALAAALLKRINQRRQRARQLSKEALRRLEAHDWPGNVRELSNVLERSVLYSRTDVLGPDDLLIVSPAPEADALALLPEPEPGFLLEEFLAQVRKQLIH
jgi:transcriptional regulator with AAA-type ATPase domain